MGFERNDVVFKDRLREALNEENTMGFEHNDIVTVDVMNKAIAEGGGGGDFEWAEMTLQLEAGLSEVEIYGFFLNDPGESEYISSDCTVRSSPVTLYAIMYKGNGVISSRGYWFEGDNITEYGEYTGGGTVTIHENSD